MTTERTGYALLDQYRFISNKLKKRFLRKPNETEASASFTALAQECEAQELSEYAAMNWLAVAKCEQFLGNFDQRAVCLLQAARQFRKAEHEDTKLKCIVTDNLQASLACYGLAIEECYAKKRRNWEKPQGYPMEIAMDLEIVNFLKKLGREDYIKIYLNHATEMAENMHDVQLHSLDLLASDFISAGDYVSALATYPKIVEILSKKELIHSNRCQLLLKCELNMVFLLLLLKPSHQNITPDQAKLLEKYAWGEEKDASLKACRMPEKLFVLMQCLVTICQSVNTSGLMEIESDFWPFLSTEQKDLFRSLVKNYYL